MATVQEQVGFVVELAGKGKLMETALARNQKRAELLEKQVGAGFDGQRDELRKAMAFKVKSKDGKKDIQSMDEKGQRKSIETGDTSRYQSISPEDLKRAGEAYKRVLKIRDDMVAAEDDDGNPLFTPTDIINELFTPLVREGLMPDNLLTDEKSEVAIMLREVMKSYKEMLKKQKEERKLAKAKVENDFLGGSGKMARVKSLGSKANALVESQLSTLASKAGMTPEEFSRARTIASKGVAFGKAIGEGIDKGQALDDELGGISKEDVEDPLTTALEKYKAENVKVSAVVENLAGSLSTITPEPLKALLSAVESELMGAAMKLDQLVNANKGAVLDVLLKFAKLIESDGADIAKDVVSVLKELGSGIKEAVDGGKDRRGLDAAIAVAVGKGKLRSGANETAQGVTQVLKLALLGRGEGTGLADIVSGGFIKLIDTNALVEMLEPALHVKPSPVPTGTAVVDLIGVAMAKAVASAHADLKPFGERLKTAFGKAASGDIGRIGSLCRSGELSDPEGVLLPLVNVAKAAASEVFESDEFNDAVAGDGISQAINAKVAENNSKAANAELEEAEAEIADFERELVLMDEGGMEMARQRSLEVLIAQMLADEADLQIVLKVGSLLSGAGGSIAKGGTNLATGVGKKVATKVTGSLVPALEAAELVMKMAVTIVKIQKRAQLMRKFKADVEHAQKAGSMLLPSIENFYGSKKQQQVYASIELALQIVQLAGAICASVPDGITKAVGEALKAAAEAAEAGRDLAKTVHDEVLLRKGWNITREAINNPGNRRAGLDALRHNNTLAVHSVAWAANNGDTMAVKIMSSCGVNAQTMADSGTDVDKLVEYLETLLSEDLQFKDADKINFDWMPSTLELSFPGWYALQQRARTKASPPLQDIKTPALDSALKQLDTIPAAKALRQSKNPPSVETLKGYVAVAQDVSNLFQSYEPKTADGRPHPDMADLCAKLKGLADNRASEITLVVNERASV